MLEENQEAADTPYRLLSDIFEGHEDKVLEIEILGSEVPLPQGHLILQDGLSIGLSKKALAKAFLEARSIFMKRDDGIDQDTVLAATKVILLFDPEYLTAANYRKQRFLTSASRMHLLNRLSDTTSWQGVKALDQELNFEMSFLDSILTSPLHRQTKSPTLWYHRLWIVADLILPLRPNGTSDDLLRTKNLVEHEICTVFKAAERHPHNYYAWQYLRRLLETLSGDNVHEFFATKEFDVGPNVHSDMPTAVMSWCLAHPSDVSGWSCLSYLIRSPWIDPYPVKVDEIVSHVMKFVISIRWTGESVWNFLAYAPPQATERFRDILEDFTRAVEGDDKARHVYKALGCMRKGWCNREPGGWR